MQAPERRSWQTEGVTPFVGRTDVLQHLTQSVLMPDVRLVTVLGPGGIGKTRLALQVAERVETSFPDGVVVIPLAAETDATMILPRVAEAFTLGEGGERPLIDRLGLTLGGTRLLLVLDNMEQIAGAGRVIAQMLGVAPGLTILATSRSPLRIAGEHEFPLAPFDLPAERSATDPETLMGTEAGEFLVRAIRRVRPDFAVTPANAPVLADMCHQLDGLPLAMELAAARIKMFSPEELHRRLDRRLSLLTSGYQDRDARQQTMRGAIAWSYELLPVRYQQIFCHLALFRSGFTVQTVEAYLGRLSTRTGRAMPDVVDGLAFLVDQSLVTRAELPDATTRFRMLETIREFGLEQLGAAGEDEVCASVFAAYWLDRAEATWQDAARLDTLTRSLAELETEHANLSAALRWLADHDAATALELAGALFWFWYVRGHHGEADREFSQLLAGPVPDVPPRVRARALMAAGAFAHFQASPERAHRYLEHALRLWRDVGDPWGMGFTLFILGVMAEDRGDYRYARDLLDEAVSLLASVDDIGTVGSARYHLAVVAFGLEEFDRARTILTTLLAEGAGGPVLRVTAWARHLQGLVCFATGDVAGALHHLQESLRGFQTFHTPPGIAEGMAGLAVVAAQTGHPLAGSLWGAAEHLMHERGDTFQLPERALYDHWVTHLRRQVGPQAFAEQVALGRSWSVDEAVAAGLALVIERAPPSSPVAAGPLALLSEREREVLRLVADGWTNDRIADHLYLSPRTVQTHLSSIYRKLNVANRTEATRILLQAHQPSYD